MGISREDTCPEAGVVNGGLGGMGNVENIGGAWIHYRVRTFMQELAIVEGAVVLVPLEANQGLPWR